MTDHWKDVREKLGIGGLGWLVIEEARAKDAEAHATELAAKDAARAKDAAEIAALKQYIARLEAELETEDV